MTNYNIIGSVTVSILNKIATIEFSHPASNSFPINLIEQLSSAISSQGKNPAINIIVLKSTGNGAFCAGASFNELLEVSSIEQGTKFFSGFANVLNTMRTCPKLIIGRVQGKSVGGGVGLVAGCDLVYATTNAAIKLSEFTIGIGPFVIEPAVTRKIGKAALSDLTLNAHEWKDADWAKSKGLYNNIYQNIEELDKDLEIISLKLASYNPQALIEMKKILWENTDNWETLLYERASISGKLALSDFTKNALKNLIS